MVNNSLIEKRNMINRTVDKEVVSILSRRYLKHISYDTYCKVFTYKGQELNVNKFNYNFMMNHDISIPDEKMRNLLQNSCKTSYSSLATYLETCHLEHGTNNSVDTLTKDVIKCKTRIEEIYIKKFLVSAVARVLSPGCQVDQVLIFQSPKQGIYKTSFFRTLAGNKNFSTILPNMNDTELMKLCSAFWLLCYDELESSLSKRNLSKLKSFITTTHDSWRRYYTTSEFDKVARTFVLCGTTNQDSFLVDHSGERRFWVVNIDGKINIEWVSQNRDRLWAEAYHLYKEGYQWWLTDDEQQDSNDLNSSYKKTDSLSQVVIDYVYEKKETGAKFRLKDLCSDLRMNTQRNGLIEILVNECNLTKPNKATRINGIKGYWWN